MIDFNEQYGPFHIPAKHRASFIQRTTGFGFGIFIMTMLPFLMPSYGEATTLSGMLTHHFSQ